MNPSEQIFAQIRERLATEPMTRFVAFGSSNTERAGHCACRYNWFDWFDVMLRERYGRKFHIINTGVGGETVHHLLGRVERDVFTYQPHVVFVTIGGNDSAPQNAIDIDDFTASLARLIDQIKARGSLVILQTYYSADLDAVRETGTEGVKRSEAFLAYMGRVRQIAAAKEVALINHLERWELLRTTDLPEYRKLMLDPFHMAPEGHKLFSLDILRNIAGDGLPAFFPEELNHARDLQARIDLLDTNYAPTGSEDEWEGFKRRSFSFAGKQAYVVRPHKPLPGNPWIWRARFFGAFPSVDLELLRQGYHLAHVDVAHLFGSPRCILPLWDAFYDYLRREWNLAEKVVLEGFSRGGLPIYNWATTHPERVACLYADAPVCDIRSWPGGKLEGPGSPSDWERCLAAYQMTDEEANDFRENPIDLLAPIVAAGIPIIHVCGDADPVVPIAENTLVLKERLEALGGSMKLIVKPGVAHHPHSLNPPDEIVDFIRKSTV